MMKNVSGVFKKGAKVYPVKVDVDFAKAKITFLVVRCDSCYNDSAQNAMKGEVVFEFPKGYPEKAGASEVEDAIGRVFTISSDDRQEQSVEAMQQSDQQAAPAEQAQSTQQAEPATVLLGMTTDRSRLRLANLTKFST